MTFHELVRSEEGPWENFPNTVKDQVNPAWLAIGRAKNNKHELSCFVGRILARHVLNCIQNRRHRISRGVCACSVLGGKFRVWTYMMESWRSKDVSSMPKQDRVSDLEATCESLTFQEFERGVCFNDLWGMNTFMGPRVHELGPQARATRFVLQSESENVW